MRRTRGRDAAILLALLAAAAAIRLPILRGELWFDEVWSLKFARGANSAADVLFGIHHDNSHPLNTLWLYFVRDSADWALLRLPSFLCGLAAVAALASDEDRPRGLLAAALAAVSAPMVLYSTEARGYAAMIACALAARLLLLSPKPAEPRRAAAFACVTTAGFLAHSTFLFPFLGLFAWAAAKLPRSGRTRDLLILFTPAPLATALFLALQRGPMIIGDGGNAGFGPVLFKTLAGWSGASGAGVAAAIGAAAFTLLCAWELARRRREGDPEIRFYAVLFAANAAFVAAVPFRYERYFAASLPFALILAARSLARLIRGGGAARAAGLAALSFFLAAGLARDAALARDGRGHYLEAVQRMTDGTPGNTITVAGDHNLRNPLMLEYYADYLKTGKTFTWIPAERRRDEPADWYLLHSFETDPALAPVALEFKGKAAYKLDGYYPYAGLSGWSWMLYRRVDAAPESSAKR